MKALYQELVICGDNKDIVSYLSKMAMAILEQAKDVKNVRVSTTKDTEPNVKIQYSLHPAGQGWIE